MRRAMNVHANVVLDATASVRTILDAVKREGRTSLTAPEGRQVCEAYDIAVPKVAIAKSADDAAGATEAGGVLVGLKSAAELCEAYERIIATVRRYDRSAHIVGVQVQQMLNDRQE